ncbi:hypothetical protein [Demequina subtropica]|uniref:hypothetical protein n=1 Tax=Demequina subtropica TaxID=1638989 RepID=UPI0007867D50|nr:hypothetical protein [Demequina subtropica]
MSSFRGSGSQVEAKEGFAIVGTFSPRVSIDGGAAAGIILGGIALMVAGVVAIVALRRVPRVARPSRDGASEPGGPA